MADAMTSVASYLRCL